MRLSSFTGRECRRGVDAMRCDCDEVSGERAITCGALRVVVLNGAAGAVTDVPSESLKNVSW